MKRSAEIVIDIRHRITVCYLPFSSTSYTITVTSRTTWSTPTYKIWSPER